MARIEVDMPEVSNASSASDTKSMAEKVRSAGVREANEVLALTLSIIRTPFGQMMSAAAPMSGEAETGAA